MTGLVLALRLAQRGFRVAVHERNPYLGGLGSEARLAGVPVERFYHCVLPTDGALLGLLGELGLGDAVGWSRTETGFFAGGRLLPMTTTRDLFRFPALRWSDRVRLAWTVARCGLVRDWRRLEREPVGPFLRRLGGRRLFEAVWEPLLLSKLGPRYDRFAASFIWATIRRMLAARKAPGRQEQLGFVRGRYGRVFAALRRALEARGGRVLAPSVVEGLERTETPRGPRWSVRAGGETLPAAAVVLCVPAPVAADWLESPLPEAAEPLRSVEYLGVVSEVLLLRRPLTPYYVLNLADRELPFTGVIEMSNLAGREEFGGRAVVYLPRYREPGSLLWRLDDARVHEENLDGLGRIAPDLGPEDVLAWEVHRERHVQPVHPVGGRTLPPARLDAGLAYVSTAQIHPWPVFHDQTIRNVEARLDEVTAAIRAAPLPGPIPARAPAVP
jgi:protoporphyrinogen oxidase